MNMTKFFQAADPIYKNPILSAPPTAVDVLMLTASVAKRYTIPTGVEFLLVNASSDIYVLFGGSGVVAAIPIADIIDGSAPMLNPGLICSLSNAGFTHLSVISEDACAVSVQRWSRR